MPIMKRAFRQRERVIERIWTPIQPELLTAQIGGAYYKKTFEKVPLTINELIDVFDTMPFGFKFDKPPTPQWEPLTTEGGIALDPMQAALLLTEVPPLNISGISQINQPGTITPEQEAAQAVGGVPGPVPQHRIIPFALAVGKTIKPLYNTSFNVRRVTILASSANIGTIWIVSGQAGQAGQGFPLVAGAAKDLGDNTLEKYKIDLSTVYLIGTDVADQVFIEAEGV